MRSKLLSANEDIGLLEVDQSQALKMTLHPTLLTIKTETVMYSYQYDIMKLR